MRTVFLLALAGLATGCATHPQRAAPSQPPAPPPPVAAAAHTSAGGTALAAATPATTDANTPDPALLRRGYKASLRHGQLYYCRSEDLTGSRFPKVICQTADQIKQQEENTRDTLGTTRPQGPCTGPYCH